MFLSLISLSLDKPDTAWGLIHPNVFHEELGACFGGRGTGRLLWRIDKIYDRMCLFVLSNEKPKLSRFCKKFSDSEDSFTVKGYDSFLDKLQENDVCRFRLAANPTWSEKSLNDSGKRGKVHAHTVPLAQKKWLIDHSAKNGFSLSEDSFAILESEWRRFMKKDGSNLSLIYVKYEGILKITNIDLFRSVLTSGIGRGKAYGMGLMTVIR